MYNPKPWRVEKRHAVGLSVVLIVFGVQMYRLVNHGE